MKRHGQRYLNLWDFHKAIKELVCSVNDKVIDIGV